VAYSMDGDILTVDPATGSRPWNTAGDHYDETPRWSLEWTRIAFLRATRPEAPTDRGGRPQRVVIVDQERNVIAESVPLAAVDIDAFAWSPDGRFIAVAGDANFKRNLFILDTADGAVRPLDVSYTHLDFYWRPGSASELLFRGSTADGSGLVVADVDDPGSARLVAADDDGAMLRPNGWTPDGRRIIYTRQIPVSQDQSLSRVRVLDLSTEAVVDIEAGYAHVSNDGKRLVAIDDDGRPCVASVDGGPCVAVAGADQAYGGTHASGATWAPNDESIMVSSFGNLALLDPAGNGTGTPPAWMTDGAESWQRVAR
jgi:Tol biopolymer transport system component